MTLLHDLFASGWICGIAAAVIWLEIAMLCLLSGQPGARFRALFANALSGTFLLVALWLALTGSAIVWIALSLAGALVAHLADLVVRLGGQTPGLRRSTE